MYNNINHTNQSAKNQPNLETTCDSISEVINACVQGIQNLTSRLSNFSNSNRFQSLLDM